VDEITVERFFRVPFVTHQTVLFHSDEDILFIYLRYLFPVEISLNPNNIFTSLKTPLLHQLPRILEMLSPSPQKNKRRTVTNLRYINLLHLLKTHCCINIILHL